MGKWTSFIKFKLSSVMVISDRYSYELSNEHNQKVKVVITTNG
jgi:hypothetical protein